MKRRNRWVMVPPPPTVFGSSPLDYDTSGNDLNLFRKPKPVSELNLRRSKRAMLNRDDFRQSTASETKSKVLSKSIGKKSKAGKMPNLPDFPDIAAIDKIMNLGLTYPATLVKEIQKVAVEHCGVHPSEVTEELLQAAGSNK
jgi:hypothetical protein